MDFNQILDIINDVPDYQTFLTVDELKASSQSLAKKYPDIVDILPIGNSRQGDPVEAIKIGNGDRKALLFAFPHPNEPIGSMMLEYLSLRLAEDASLRESLGYTWYLIKCIDPDGTRLNEGWFKGPFSIEHYARHFYRPVSFQQIEWTFPVDYETLHFHNPLPETQALMDLIENTQPDFIFSLHNSGFGGVYFYITEEAPALYDPFHRLVESQDLPLHLGEPEMPYIKKYASAIFEDTGIAEEYGFFKKHTDTDPAEIFKQGTTSFDYAKRYCNPFGLVCEVPYFYNPAINDTSPSDIVRRDAILQGLEQQKKHYSFLRQQYNKAWDEITIQSPFRDFIDEILRTYQQHIAAEENWAQTDPEAAEIATVAEKFDNLVIRKFDSLFLLGMFVRMLDGQIKATGESSILGSVLEESKAAFETSCSELETSLDYTVIPIQKLVRVQLGSALLSADYASKRKQKAI
jgi:hypothetical protein